MKECSISRGEGIWKNTPYAGGKEYKKIVHIDDLRSMPIERPL